MQSVCLIPVDSVKPGSLMETLKSLNSVVWNDTHCTYSLRYTPIERCVIQGQTFQSCVSQCPRTCNNYRDSFTCTEQCVPGCTCPDNMVS